MHARTHTYINYEWSTPHKSNDEAEVPMTRENAKKVNYKKERLEGTIEN